ncbi:MAG: carbon storage regulator CsrA [Spirochaetaceae bacterium]|jgi:carbon storage regulator|nr:carbon storage regulator CsrA [Spirochaetaceae bacterium]
MLILSRKVNEKIMIGEDISVSILEIRGDQVRIGVEAPRQVKVFRQEVFDAIKAENEAALDSNPVLPELGIKEERRSI